MSATSLPPIPIVPAVIAVSLAAHGLRKKSLSPSGAVAAVFVGFLMMAVPLRAFGVSLIVFYLIGSQATKFGKGAKAKLEEDHAEAGYRDGWQVLSNSFSALVGSTLWAIVFAPTSIHYWIWFTLFVPYINFPGNLAKPFRGDQWCTIEEPVSRKFIYMALGHFACCLGDTLASEIGILSTKPPTLITTFKKVPPGTNGAVTKQGLFSSAIGGVIMGTTLAVSIYIENSACGYSKVDTFWIPTMVVSGGAAGLFGSLVDSLLGATIQRTRYSVDTKKVLLDHSEVPKDANLKVISGLNILTNNQVNVVSSIVTAALLGLLA